ncbi:transglutaminase domain-containing protein [Dermacoccus abyssi]|uniref:Transglutaminase domain-containing protein n=1 Tax=Dermacoccus abyssi TaxID=322596 RepID=A0ABX5Z8S3_9MICO|nr:transglutaminase domain-containing protein [Dermacoccus abyssi]
MKSRQLVTDVALLLLALTASWPLVELTSASALVGPAIAVVVLVWFVGALCRFTGRTPALTVTAQLVMLLVGTVGVFLAKGGSLSSASVRATAKLAKEAADTSVAPLPAMLGVIVMLALAAGLVTLVVDYVGGTARMPMLTVLPVAAPFILATTALGDTLRTRYFVAAAIAWALVVMAASFAEGTSLRSGLVRSLPVFAVMTAVAVLAALLLAPSVPQRATPALAEGGARGVNNSVDFSETLDLSKSLNSRNAAPVLTYTTEATTPAPLRATTSSSYADGVWRAESSGPFTDARPNTELPNPGAEDSMPSRTERMSVTLNGMRPPFIAAPAPLRAANFGSANPTFRVGTNTGVPFLSQPAPAYSVLYREYTAAARPTSNERAGVGGSVTAKDLDTGTLPEAAKQRVTQLNQDSGAADAGTPFEQAVALQRYLRTDPSFTYSLKLAPTRSENGRQLDPLSNFLETRQGYCTQFATAMVMGAREMGLPARIAIGFLPGTERSGTYEVRATDAHAWAEVYFPGMGWTRFDPTPGLRSGAPPAYAPDTPTGDASASSSSSAPTSSTSTSSSTSSVRPSTETSTSSSTTQPAKPESDSFPWTRVFAVLGGLALVALLASVLPLAGRRKRQEVTRTASTDRERDEGAWHAMLWSLRDLGYTTPEGLSPRATAEAFTRDNPESGTTVREALERACSGMEASRYAPTAGRSQASACDRVVRAARDEASLGARVKALLAPASGRAYLTALGRRNRT